MTGLVCGLLAFGLLATTALAAAATLRLRSLAEFALAAYLLAYGEAVLLVLVLSPFGAVERPVLLVGLAIPCVVAASAWWWRGHPLPDVSGLRRVASLMRSDRIFWPLGGVVALALAYTVALILGTPPNNGDSLAYHLARAAFWRQDGGVGYIEHAYDGLDAFPPNTEAVFTLIMEVTRSERALGFVQFGSVMACAVAVFALARRIRCSEREATFAALVFLTLPTVLLQASTTKNDLVVAASLLAATAFLVGDRRWPNHALVVLATALAVGTKVLALFALPLLAIVAIGVRPAEQRPQRLLALAAGIALGSYWYVLNVLKTGRILGDVGAEDSTVIFQIQENVLSAAALVLDTFDVSGAVKADVLVYALVAALFFVPSILRRQNDGAGSASLLSVCLFVAVFPFGVLASSYVLWHGFETLDDHLDAPNDDLPRYGWATPTQASESFSWFGPIGPLLLVAAGATAVVLVRRGSWSRLALLFGFAPLVWLIIVAASLPYHPSYGRYFIFPVALSASLWGLVLRVRAAAWAICALSATTALLSVVHFFEKPSGLRLLEGDVPETIWGAERWRVHSAPKPETPQAALRFLATLPKNDSVALALGYNDFTYAAFGPRFERRVELVPEGSDGRTVDAMWLLANASRADTIDATCWRPVVESPEGWVGFRRRDACRQ
jgi:hypothetical protein